MNKSNTHKEPTKIDDRHKAPLLLVAHMKYVTETGELIRKNDLVVARCFTRTEARRFMEDIKTTDTFKYIGIKNGVPTYVEAKGPAPKISSLRGGQTIYEVIENFTIVDKTQYYAERSSHNV